MRFWRNFFRSRNEETDRRGSRIDLDTNAAVVVFVQLCLCIIDHLRFRHRSCRICVSVFDCWAFLIERIEQWINTRASPRIVPRQSYHDNTELRKTLILRWQRRALETVAAAQIHDRSSVPGWVFFTIIHLSAMAWIVSLKQHGLETIVHEYFRQTQLAAENLDVEIKQANRLQAWWRGSIWRLRLRWLQLRPT